MSLFKKNISTSTPLPVRQQNLKVSPYENPEVTLELMGKICSAQAKVDFNLFNVAFRKAVEKEVGDIFAVNRYIEDGIITPDNEEFLDDLRKIRLSIDWELEQNNGHQGGNYTYIVVAGGYSSGKSSFLNSLTKQRGLLPTGTKPVSVVNTCLYCSKQSRDVMVQGMNHKDILVELDPGVLQAIQHADDTEVHLASVLEELFVTIPSQELDGLAFIDTPGYNNSLSANASNGKTDEDTATEAFEQGDVLFWFIDSERGTISADDLKKVKEFERKKVIIFTKADKKGAAESKSIVEAAYKVVAKHLDMSEVLDIMAYSSIDNKVVYSRKYNTIDKLLKAVHQEKGTNGDGIERLQAEYATLFDVEIEAEENYAKSLDAELTELAEEKSEFAKEIRENNKWGRDIKASLLEVVSENIDFKNDDAMWRAKNQEAMASAKRLSRDGGSFDSWFEHFLKHPEKKTQDYSVLTTDDYPIIEAFEELVDYYCNQRESNYKSLCEDQEEKRERYKASMDFVTAMKRFKRVYTNALDAAIRAYRKQSGATKVQVTRQSYDVFEAIKQRNYKAFLRSFEYGIELSLCNKEGFTPLTYAAHCGNDAMVSFLLTHDADCAGVDKRGYNALHSAFLAGHRGICEMLLAHDPSLKNCAACPKGEVKPMKTLIAESDFQLWAEYTFG